MGHGERIRWAPRVSQGKIWQLYQTDARGLVDEELIDEVGFALYSRAQSILLIGEAKVECPRCREVFVVGREHQDEDVITCPTAECSWQLTFLQYRQSWHRQHLIGMNANSDLERFVESFPRAQQPQEKMVLIDQLIHAFHVKLKEREPLKSAAPNLIEGKGPKVVAFLDRLAYGDGSALEVIETRDRWRKRLEEELNRRSVL